MRRSQMLHLVAFWRSAMKLAASSTCRLAGSMCTPYLMEHISLAPGAWEAEGRGPFFLCSNRRMGCATTGTSPSTTHTHTHTHGWSSNSEPEDAGRRLRSASKHWQRQKPSRASAQRGHGHGFEGLQKATVISPHLEGISRSIPCTTTLCRA